MSAAPAELLSADDLVTGLIAEHSRSVTAYVDRLVRDQHLAQDVAQETFLRAWKQAERLQKGSGSMRGWLLTVARNIAIDRLRSASGRRELVSADPGEARGWDDDPAKNVVGDDHVAGLLGSLPPEQRSVVYLTVIVGLSTGETAQRLGVPAGTVKSRRHYALRALRGRLEGDLPMAA